VDPTGFEGMLGSCGGLAPAARLHTWRRPEGHRGMVARSRVASIAQSRVVTDDLGRRQQFHTPIAAVMELVNVAFEGLRTTPPARLSPRRRLCR